MSNNLLASHRDTTIDSNSPLLLYASAGHKIYWMGIEEETAFRCNVYLIEDGEEFFLVDPGSRLYHNELKKRVATIVDPTKVNGLIICHQDPDVAASMVDWIDINPDVQIFTSMRTNVLLRYYGREKYRFFDIGEQGSYTFASGRTLQFIEAPFLHSPGAFTTFDLSSKMLFSGDIWAALDTDWELVVTDFETHRHHMDLFHLDYMASNIAARGFVRKIEHERIEAILPQHGSIIPKEHVRDALHYLRELHCGLDILYADQ